MLTNNLPQLQQLVGNVITDSRSPAGNWLQPRLESIAEGQAEISVLIRPEMCNPFGNIHGGMMSLVIDECIGWAIVSLQASQHYTSVTLHVDFLYAAAHDERIFAFTRVRRQGKKIINTETEVTNSKGVLLARASSNLVVTGMQIPGAVSV